MEHTIRAYEPDDLPAVTRIWQEVGWIDDDEGKKAALEGFLSVGDAEVALVAGEAECMVHRTPGSMVYDTSPLPLCAISALTTSLVGRKQGFASRLTARALQQGHADGAAVAALGMFEQGFYDRFGFGTSSYDHELSFDPATLDVGHVPYRPPVRLDVADGPELHAALVRRRLAHGAVTLDPPQIIASEMGWTDGLRALGYRDETGRLTHGFYGSMKDTEHGPLRVVSMAYETTEQLLELLRLFRELADQIRTVIMLEPAHAQLQTLIREPMRQQQRAASGPHVGKHRALAWMQFRVLDVAACVAARSWVGPDVAFNLTLTDPLAELPGADWPGVGGEYTIRLAEDSAATAGHGAGLPLVEADVGAFSRLWFGVAPATSLVATDRFHGPRELLEALDRALLLPPIRSGWDF